MNTENPNDTEALKGAVNALMQLYLPTMEAAFEMMGEYASAQNTAENGAQSEYKPANRLERMAYMFRYAFCCGASAALEMAQRTFETEPAAQMQSEARPE